MNLTPFMNLVTRQSYPLVLIGYHIAIAICALIAWLVLCRALKISDRRDRFAWAITVFTAIEAIALTPMTGFVEARVGIRDEALNFLITHSVALSFCLLGGCVMAVKVKQHKVLLYLINMLSFLLALVAWLSG